MNLEDGKHIKESILDPIHKELNDEIFDSNNTIKEEVSDYIIEVFTNWWVALGYDINNIRAMVIIGSMVGYQYSSNSDIDVNVRVTISENEIKKVLKLLPNGNILLNTQHPINYYLTKTSENIDKADNAYDLFDDKWIKEPEKKEINIPYIYVLEITKLFMDGIDLRISEYERDNQELEMYKDFLNDKTLEINKEEINDMVVVKETELMADLESLYIAYKMIKSFRHEAFEDDYEPHFLINIEIENPNFSINNIAYKILEKFGYLEKLKKYILKRKEYIEE